MNDIEYIQYEIKELGNSYELHNQEWAKRILKEMNNSLEKLLKENKDLQKSVDQIYEDYQDIGKMYFNLTEKIEKKIEELKPINFDTADDRDYIIKVLEELLKGE